MSEFFMSCDEAQIKRERAKARELRQSQWWKNQLGKGVCHYCEGKFTKSDLSMDHVLPIARGGLSNKSNVVVCCKKCNSEKKYHLPVELTFQRLKDQNNFES